MRRRWPVLIALVWVATACSQGGGGGTPTGPTSAALEAKPKRTVTLLCTGQVSVNVRFLQGGFTGTEVGSVDLGASGSDGCGQSAVVTGVGKADFYRAAYQAPTGGQFTNSVLPGKGATDEFILNGTVLATLIIK